MMSPHARARRGARFGIAGLLVAGALSASSCAHAPVARGIRSPATDRQTAARLLARFDSLRVANRIPGLAVVILSDTTVVLSEGLGYANVDQREPVTPDTPFNIASVTKPNSGVVAMRLVERGVLDLDRLMTSFADFAEFCADVRSAGGLFFG